MKNTKIAIGAIFKNEIHYVIEWIAWHRLAGFQKFYIADNVSTDGTRSLLEALSEIIPLIKIFYQPSVEINSQQRAYNTILNMASLEVEYILFIDADEFLIHESYEIGAEYAYLEKILQKQNIGMVAINWRTYGSSGLKSYDSRPVVERFTFHSADEVHSKKNHYIKSASKIEAVQFAFPHRCTLAPGYTIADSIGNDLTKFIFSEDTWLATESPTGITSSIVKSPLRVNHYVIKSLEEFRDLKATRGTAWNKSAGPKTDEYFANHDFYDEETKIPSEKIINLVNEIDILNLELTKTCYYKKIIGCVDQNDANIIQGWATDDHGASNGFKINIFLNSNLIGTVSCKYFRKDVIKAGISVDGLCGFRFQHPAELKKGDQIEVYIHANNSILAGKSKCTI